MEDKKKLLILYATQTGNAMDAANILQREAERRCCQVTLLSIDDFDASVAKNLDNCAIVQTGLGDDQHSLGYEGALGPWMSSLWNSLCQCNPKLLPRGPDFTINNNPLSKDVRQLECAVSSSVMYNVGDVLAVLPEQSPAAVDAFIKRCNLDPESNITIQHKNKECPDALKTPIRLETYVKSMYNAVPFRASGHVKRN
ncbi:hypothetical protein POM88_005402 [Heracleum sosnowskyi]|uniref:Flavodoxin-like domain-containing protein n=1 Tax=Heracleum sosnowskyi TaxID=360622 RepID=A0AAD8N3Q6_9APIA|nr:hypothetical protein POM88_005402 [Heracleum sosnowskyi]